MSQAPLYLNRCGPRADLVLNRPSRRNAFTAEMWEAFPRLLDEIAEEDGIKALVVRGEGGAFTSGADVGEFESVYATREQAEAYSDSIADALDRLAVFPKPTIALIRGACVGGGCGIALACDLRFAAPDSRFGITPSKLGLVYPFNDTRRLVDAVGISNAKDLLYTGRLLDSEEALAMGLINRVLPQAELEGAVSGYIDTLLTRSSHTARMSKHMINLIRGGQDEDTETTRQIFRDAFQGEDFREGYRAFLEKRPPAFSGEPEE